MRELVIANGTLKAHIQPIYAQLGVHSKRELALLFEDAGPADDGPPRPTEPPARPPLVLRPWRGGPCYTLGRAAVRLARPRTRT